MSDDSYTMRRARFDRIAHQYDTYRPGYPSEVVDSILATTHVLPNARILEIGSGSGKATVLFARRGYSMLCIEPSRELTRIATQKLTGLTNVEFVTATFEDWEEEQTEFDLVVSAQSFHWIPPEIGYAKAARVLKKQGYLALFWNMYPDSEENVLQELKRVFQEYAPSLNRANYSEELVSQSAMQIADSGHFSNVETRRFSWSARYSTEQYLGLLQTYGVYARLTAERRKSLFAGVAEAIDKHGGYLDKPYITALYVAQKRSTT